MRLLFQAKTAWRQLKCIKMLCLSPIFTDNEHVFHNVELIFKHNFVWKQLFLDFPHKIILLFSDLIFPD